MTDRKESEVILECQNEKGLLPQSGLQLVLFPITNKRYTEKEDFVYTQTIGILYSS